MKIEKMEVNAVSKLSAHLATQTGRFFEKL
jgi:hypothetical protein